MAPTQPNPLSAQPSPGRCDCRAGGVIRRIHPRAGVVEMRCRAAMEYLDSTLDSDHGARIVVSDRARDAIRCLCRADGPQALVVAWPGGVAYLPAAMFSRSEFDVILGHIARCPVYADVRQLGAFADRHAVLDLAESMEWRERPLLRLRSAPAATVIEQHHGPGS